MKNIIHDWPDEKALQILRNVRAAAGSGGHGAAGRIRHPQAQPGLPRKVGGSGDDAELGARERTAAEYGDLLAKRVPA